MMSVFNGVDAMTVQMGDGGKLSEDSTTIVWKNVATGQAGEGLTTQDDG